MAPLLKEKKVIPLELVSKSVLSQDTNGRPWIEYIVQSVSIDKNYSDMSDRR